MASAKRDGRKMHADATAAGGAAVNRACAALAVCAVAYQGVARASAPRTTGCGGGETAAADERGDIYRGSYHAHIRLYSFRCSNAENGSRGIKGGGGRRTLASKATRTRGDIHLLGKTVRCHVRVRGARRAASTRRARLATTPRVKRTV